MLGTESSLMDSISFWGGICSIAAFAITLIGGAIALFRIMAKSVLIELERLEADQQELGDRIQAATTQGKRMDLFIYQQSVFSSLRHKILSLEIVAAAYHVSCVVVLIWVATLDLNADYASDRLFPNVLDWREYFEFVYIGTTVFLMVGMLVVRRKLEWRRRKLQLLTNKFTSELRKVVETKIPVDD